MSMVTRWSMPSCSATKRLAITPPVGPDSTIWTGASAAASRVISPPFDLMITAGALMPASSSRPRMASSCRPTIGFR